ncbi:MAG: hypothetical protein OXI67_10590 [Candidatus Poribacteria bacterium]|nr:hypothetical protein [Candidatus Poribacteria bacterium]
MKNKNILLLSVILIIAVVGVVLYFILRLPPQELFPQIFAQLPEKPKLIAEFNHGATLDSDAIPFEGFTLTDATPIYSVAFSPIDASLIASVNANGSIKLWNINNTKEPVKILRHPGVYPIIRFSPTGELLASAGYGKLVFWDVASGTKLNSLEAAGGDFALSPNGQLATTPDDVKLWDIRNPKEIKEVATLPFDEEHKIRSWACAVAISTDGKLIAAGYANGYVNVWNLQTKQHVKTLKTPFIEMRYLKFSTNRKYLVSGGNEWKHSGPRGYVMWELLSWQRHGEVQRGHIENLAFSPDGKICASANHQSYSGRGVELWTVKSGAPITVLPTARDVSFSQDGKRIASGNDDGIVQLWELTSQQLALASIPTDMVRLIYVPSEDEEPPPDITVKLDKSIREAQDFYADEMERHGFGRKTFTFETDENGKAKIYHGKYNQTNIDLSNDIWLIIGGDESQIFPSDPTSLYIDHYDTFSYTRNDGYSTKNNVWREKIKGIIKATHVQASVKFLDRKSVAYALRSAFSVPGIHTEPEPNALKRLFSRVNDKMPWGKRWAKLSRCEAEWLDKSRYFNPNQPFFDKAPKMEMRVSVPKDNGLRHFIFDVADEDGMHHAQLFVIQRWKLKFHNCQALNGKQEATIAFEITDAKIKTVKLRMIDMHGNIAARDFQIQEKTDEK